MATATLSCLWIISQSGQKPLPLADRPLKRLMIVLLMYVDMEHPESWYWTEEQIYSHLMQEICELFDIMKVNSTSYHPQTDGLVENFNEVLRSMLAKSPV